MEVWMILATEGDNVLTGAQQIPTSSRKTPGRNLNEWLGLVSYPPGPRFHDLFEEKARLLPKGTFVLSGGEVGID